MQNILDGCFFDLEMKNSFSSVQTNAYTFAINNPQQSEKGIPLELCIPPTDEGRLAIEDKKEQ
ncbi:hypothetical protein KHA80_09230 [Anaerobacillus sp. HL2]|nr:hypothetical protein KHA80_09230 [Anaerobacillus sp. HL2]